MVNLEYYKAFYFVAKNGSLTAAAKELFVTQPALSQTILQLEEQLGGTLFTRTPKGMVLTSEGEKIYEYVEQALNLFDTAQKSFDEMKNLKAGSIRIGASDTICSRYLLKYITKFHELFPEISISVTNRTSHQTAALLKAGEVDIAFINLPISETGSYDISQCLTLHDCFICGEKYRSRFTEPIGMREIAEYPLIMMEKLSNTRQVFDNFMLSKGLSIKPSIELGSFDLVVEFAKYGLGIGCVTREFITRELLNDEVFEIPISFELPERAIGTLLRKDTPLTFAARSFMDLINSK